MRTLMHDPIRPDLAVKNVAKGGVMLAVLWVPAAVAGIRVDGSRWLALPMVAGLLSSGVVFQADAPVAAIVVSVLSGAAFWKFPRLAPKALGVGVALFFLLTPSLMRQARASGLFDLLQKKVETSWSERVGYWSHAIDWIGDHRLRGWGLDASRMFAPGIQLHPHDAALQVWLELGLIGAVTVGVFWAALFFRLSRRTPDLATMAGVVSAVAYMVFAAVSFGVWQEWWLALGALAAIACTLIARQPPVVQKAHGAPGAVQASTIAP
jgi:O-antigen ligase